MRPVVVRGCSPPLFSLTMAHTNGCKSKWLCWSVWLSPLRLTGSTKLVTAGQTANVKGNRVCILFLYGKPIYIFASRLICWHTWSKDNLYYKAIKCVKWKCESLNITHNCEHKYPPALGVCSTALLYWFTPLLLQHFQLFPLRKLWKLQNLAQTTCWEAHSWQTHLETSWWTQPSVESKSVETTIRVKRKVTVDLCSPRDQKCDCE